MLRKINKDQLLPFEFLISCNDNQSYISHSDPFAGSVSCTWYVSCLSSFPTVQVRVCELFHDLLLCSGILWGFVQTMLEKNLVPNSSYTIKYDVCHSIFSKLTAWVWMGKFKFRSFRKVISADNGFDKICTFRNTLHTHTLYRCWVVFKWTFLVGKGMFSSISVMKTPAVFIGMQMKGGSCSELSISLHIFAFLVLSYLIQSNYCFITWKRGQTVI